jgi:hypothetical protein
LQKPSALSESCALRTVRSHELNSKLNKSSNAHSRNKRQTFTKSSGTCSKVSLSSNISKRETFKSLESLFDLNKPFHLSVENLPYAQLPYEEKTGDSSGDCSSEYKLGQVSDYIEQLKPVFYEPDDELPVCPLKP